jgi:hypothetical protein
MGLGVGLDPLAVIVVRNLVIGAVDECRHNSPFIEATPYAQKYVA